MSVIGSLAAFDHWRQRVYLIESVPVLGLDAPSARRRLRRGRRPRRARRVADLGPAARRTCRSRRPSPATRCPSVRSTMPDGMYQQAVEVAKEHIVAGDIFQVVLAQRYDLELDADPFDVYRVLRQVNPSPYMYFLRHPEITIVGSSPEPMVQLLDGKVISPARSPAPAAAAATDEHDRRMAGELKENPKEVAEHVMLVDLARNDVGRVAQFGTVHVDELMTLERYSHVMHLTSQVSGRAGRRQDARSTCCGPRCRPARSAARRRCGRWRSSTSSSRSSAGPYAGVVGYVDFSRQPRHGDRHPHDVRRPARRVAAGRRRASSPTRSPTTRTSSAATRPPRCSPRSPRPAG